MVAFFFRIDAALERMLNSPKKNTGALRRALAKAKAAGLTPALSTVMQQVEHHLEQAISDICVKCD